MNFSINSSDFVGLIGSSGSGKSVFVKILIGIMRPTKGKININGKMGFSLQNNSFYKKLTLYQNLVFFSKIYKVKDYKTKIGELMNSLDLLNFRNTLASSLSGGTQKRLDLACALLNDPEILLLDEPFVGLDPFLVKELMQLYKNLNINGITIILSSHRLDVIESLCNKFFIVHEKKLFSLSKNQLKDIYKTQQ